MATQGLRHALDKVIIDDRSDHSRQVRPNQSSSSGQKDCSPA